MTALLAECVRRQSDTSLAAAHFMSCDEIVRFLVPSGADGGEGERT